MEDLEAAASSPSPGSAEVAGNVVQGSTAKRSRVALPDNKSSPTFQAERSSSRPDTSVLPQDSATSSESRPGYTGKLIANAAETTYNDALLDQTRGRHPQERPASEVLKVNEEFIAANCETEEAALALESLCRTNSGDVSERSDVTAAGLKSAGGSFSLNSTAVPQVGQERSGAASSMSMGIILNPPLAENSTIPRTVTMSAAERKYRSTILIDPTSGGMTGHRLQRSLDTRLRIFTSPNFPNKALCDHIVWSYFRHLDPLWHVHIGWLFDDEYREFWKLRNDGRHLEVDPAWAALFLMTLALGE